MRNSSSSRVEAKVKSLRLGCVALALGLAQVASVPAEAQSEQRRAKPAARSTEQAQLATAQGPLISLVSLNQQRMYVYDANGFVVQTRISSGRPGYETPKGIYSILEKKVDHTSNIYLDAKMPHMQRLTMTGIALHGGVVPGYAASGGCVRMPFDFARRFFSMTDINQRVVIAPDVQAPVAFEHPLLFSALPSAAALTPALRHAETGDGKPTSESGDVTDMLLGVSTAHAATELEAQADGVRTQERAEKERAAERQRLAEAISAAEERRTTAGEQEKTAQGALAEARTAAKAAATASTRAARAYSKAKAALQPHERALKRAQSRIPKDSSKVRADRLDDLRSQEAAARERLAAATRDAEQAEADAKRAADEAKAAEKAVADAQAALTAAKAESKEAATAEAAAKKAVAAFDRQEQNRALPVSVFVSSHTGTVSVRQGFELVVEAQAVIDSPEVPLDTFLFTALDWKDEGKTELLWSATEVNENSIGRDDEVGSSSKKKSAKSVRLPPPTDTDKAARTLDRIRIPKHVANRIAEVVKPGSSLIVSSYDVSRSEMKYPGTDFIVQMPEVVAKITKPTPRPAPVDVVEDPGDGFFFFGPSNYSSSYGRDRDRDRRKRRMGSSKSFFW